MEERLKRTHRRKRRKSKRKRLVIFSIFVAFFGFFSFIFIHSLKNQQPRAKTSSVSIQIPGALKSALEEASAKNHPNMLRKFPYPFKAMLAISSDADMATLEEFEEYHRFLNTKELTPYGQGLGLDIADSSWLYIANDTSEKIDKEGHSVDYSMSYFQGIDPNKTKDADKILHYFKVGWIDSLHTYGDFSRNDRSVKFSRDLAVAAWQAMNQSGFKPEVWINHGSETNSQNFGAFNPKNHFFDYQQGDNPQSPYYHTDLALKNGIRYVWNSMGENQFSIEDPLFPIHLRDGQSVWGFHRYTHDLNKGKADWTWETPLISRQITQQRLDRLVQEGKYSIIAQHLGKGSHGFPFNKEGIQSLNLLKKYNDDGMILIARTVRLLNYARSSHYVHYSVVQWEGKTYIDIDSVEDPVLGSSIPTLDQIRGLTFYVNDPQNTEILLNFNPIEPEEIQQNGEDNAGKKSIGIKWFKPDYTDHTNDT